MWFNYITKDWTGELSFSVGYLLNLYKKTSSRLSTGRLVSKCSMRRMRKLCTLCPHIGDAKELEVVDAMDAEDHG